MTHNLLDTEVNRAGTASLKWDFRETIVGRDDVIPMWVADMDFPAPEAVRQALTERAEHGVYGYTKPLPGYYAALTHWYDRRFGYSIEREWVVTSPGIVPALNMAIQAFSKPGDGIIIQNPVYHPFAQAVRANGRRLLVNNLIEAEGRYSIDFDDLETKAQDGAKLLLLCSPHNPCSRVWRDWEQRRMAEICLNHGLLVAADEIHGDLVLPGFRHTPFPLAAPEAQDQMLLCTAPSKTFNIPGLATSNIIIPNETLRNEFSAALNRCGIGMSNFFGVTAAEAAYLHGEQWLHQVMDYVADNHKFLACFLAERLPEVSVSPLEATFLAWLDCRKLLGRLGESSGKGSSNKGSSSRSKSCKGSSGWLKLFLVREAGVWLEAGSTFGKSGEGFMRMNIGCPRHRMVEALEKIARAVT